VLEASGNMTLDRVRRVAGWSEGGPWPRQMTPPVVQRRLGVEFGGQVRLAGYDGPDVAAEAVTLRLVWQGLGAARGDWTRFAQLIGPDGSILAQHDSPPDGGAYPTSLWAEGEYVAETVVLPLDAPLPAGTYTLRAGLYNPATGQRLANDRHQDHISIAIQQE
ncbi:MAG: hypothetical protein ACE5G8_15665, partial [Anaerolineae bacterium]